MKYLKQLKFLVKQKKANEFDELQKYPASVLP